MTESSVQTRFNDYERRRGDFLPLFTILRDAFPIQRVLYPGSYIHIAPSFIFPYVTYVDTDPPTKRFFADRDEVAALIRQRQHYEQEAAFSFHAADYTTDFGEPERSFDLLISLYAGFVSQACKRYLRCGGWLVANNSHGDASMASIDPDYEFCGAIMGRGSKLRLQTDPLDHFFIPKRPIDVTREHLERTGRGIGYTVSPAAYLFLRRA